MSLCVLCGLQLSGDAALCPHHHCAYGDDWAAANRLICNGIHRGDWAPRLAKADRDDDFWSQTAPAAEEAVAY